MNKIFKISAPAVCALLCACAVGPDYEKPKYDAPQKWASETSAQSAADISKWWESFGDETLNSLIARGIAGNYSMAAAQARIDQAAATLGITRSGLFPTLDADGKITESGKFSGGTDQLYNMGATASWEVDIFGGIRRDVESKRADYSAAMADKYAVQIAVSSQIAQNYFLYRCLQQQIEIMRQNLETQRRTLKIAQKKRASGFAADYDVYRAQAQTLTTSSEIPSLERDLEQTRHALEYLLAVPIGSLAAELAEAKDLPALENFTPDAGVPAKLLERRPDIVMAEYKIKAASERIGAATADYFPRFFISGNIFYQAPSTANFFSSSHGNWSVGPSVSWNLFSAGKTMQNVELQKAITREANISWEDSVLNAIKEVEDALVGISKEKARTVLLRDVAKNNRSAFKIADRLYNEGEIEFLDLLDIQRTMLTSEQAEVLSRKQLAVFISSLYAALGGGWDMEVAAPQSEKSAL